MEYLWARGRWDVPLFHAQHVLNLLQRLLFAVFSVLANFGILYFHWTTPPHPKFTVLARSRWSIRAHLLSGTIGVVIPIWAFCTTSSRISSAIMWTVACTDVVHLATVIMQTPNVNGQRLLIVPAYQFISAIKLVTLAGMVSALLDSSLYQIEKLEWLWALWANHQTYAWVRVWIMLLHVCQACRESRYTVAVIIAGTIGAGQAYGFSVMLLLIFWLMVFNLYLRRKTYELSAKYSIAVRDGATNMEALNLEMSAMLQYFHESHHSLFHDIRYKQQPTIVQTILSETGFAKVEVDESGTETLTLAPIKSIPDEVQAKCIFRAIDFDGNGTLDVLELAQIFITNGVSMEATKQMCEKAFGDFDVNHDGLLDLEEFTKYFKPYWSYQFSEVYYLLKESPALLKNVINVPLHGAPGGCPFGRSHSIPLDFESVALSWAKLVRGKNSKKLDRALSRVESRLKQRAAPERDRPPRDARDQYFVMRFLRHPREHAPSDG